MAKRKWLGVWWQRILLAVIAALGSFFIGMVLPWINQEIQAISQPQIPQVQPEEQAKEIDTNSGIFAQSNEALKKLITRLEEQEKEAALTFSVPQEFQGKTLADLKLKTKEKLIALTFDDGPYPKWTEQILEILKKNNIKGTFYWIGQNVKNFPDIGRQVVAEGHAIANHTWHHWYHRMSPATAAREIEDTAKIIYETTGVKTSLFRPPGGFLNNGLADYAKKKKYLVTMWSADSKDYSRPSVEKLVNNVLKNAHSGGMVLLHDGGGDREQTVQALPIIIEKLKAQGYQFVTVPELFEIQQQYIAAKKPFTVADLIEKPKLGP